MLELDAEGAEVIGEELQGVHQTGVNVVEADGVVTNGLRSLQNQMQQTLL